LRFFLLQQGSYFEGFLRVTWEYSLQYGDMGRGMRHMGRGMRHMGRGMRHMGRGMRHMGRGLKN
jgi:hypothetical protein